MELRPCWARKVLYHEATHLPLLLPSMEGKPWICSGATRAEEIMQWEAGMPPHCHLLPRKPLHSVPATLHLSCQGLLCSDHLLFPTNIKLLTHTSLLVKTRLFQGHHFLQSRTTEASVLIRPCSKSRTAPMCHAKVLHFLYLEIGITMSSCRTTESLNTSSM